MMPAIAGAQSPFENESIVDDIHAVLESQFPQHPFAAGLTPDKTTGVMGSYLAMSQAFPYLQAAAQKDLIFSHMEKNEDIPSAMEKMMAVGSFLCWDETGGNWLLRQHGMAGLPALLNTGTHFHANLLKSDLATLFGKSLQPNYDAATVEYLKGLYLGLSSLDPVIRCATMVAFESHAERMISALWRSLAQLFQADKDRLTYFSAHVGGDDPAEAYHVSMTSRLIEDVVAEKEQARFLEAFTQAYRLNHDWCATLLA